MLEQLEVLAVEAVIERRRKHRLLKSGLRGNYKGTVTKATDAMRVQTLCEVIALHTGEALGIVQARAEREAAERIKAR